MSMARKIMVANESPGISRSTLFPTIPDMGTGRIPKATISIETALGPVLWSKLQTALEARKSPVALMEKARKLIASVDATLYEKGYILSPSAGHAIDGGAVLSDGIIHRLNDSKGREAFRDVFDVELWTRPQGSDRTIKDDLQLLPEDHRLDEREVAYFGQPGEYLGTVIYNKVEEK